MVDRLGVHRTDDAELVDDPCGVRKQLAHPEAVRAVLLELELGARQRQRRLIAAHAGESLTLPDRVRELLAVAFLKERLVIEEIELRRAAALHEGDDPLRGRGEVRACRDAERARLSTRRREQRDVARRE